MDLRTLLQTQLDGLAKNNQLFVRCPNCKHEISITPDTDIDNILCPECSHTIGLKIHFVAE